MGLYHGVRGRTLAEVISNSVFDFASKGRVSMDSAQSVPGSC
jgi:hypothetical protein